MRWPVLRELFAEGEPGVLATTEIKPRVPLPRAHSISRGHPQNPPAPHTPMPPPPAHPGIPRLRSPAPCGASPSRLPQGPSRFWGGSALPPAARCPSHRTTTVHTTLYQHDSTAHTTTPRSRTTKTAWQWDVPRGHHAVGQGEAGGGERGRCKQGGFSPTAGAAAPLPRWSAHICDTGGVFGGSLCPSIPPAMPDGRDSPAGPCWCCWMCLEEPGPLPFLPCLGGRAPALSRGSPRRPPRLSSPAALHTLPAELGCRGLNSHLQLVSNYLNMPETRGGV